MKNYALALVLALGGSVLVGCGDDDGGPVDASSGADAGTTDAGSPAEAGTSDAGSADAAAPDDAATPDDAGAPDGGEMADGGALDGGSDAGVVLGPTPGPGDLVIVEIQGNPQNTNDDQAEYIELLNVSGRELELQGVQLEHRAWSSGSEPAASGSIHVIGTSVPVAPGARVLLARSSGGFFGGATHDYVYGGFVFGNGAEINRLRVLVPSWDRSAPPAATDIVDEVRTPAGAFENALRGRALQLDPDAVPSPTAASNDDPADWCHAAATTALAYWMSNWGTPGAANRCD